MAACDKFSPYISVLLNITPDHLDWHGDFNKYTEAKLKVFNGSEVAVLNMDDKAVAECFDEITKKDAGLIIKNHYADDNIIVEYKGLSQNSVSLHILRSQNYRIDCSKSGISYYNAG